MGFDVGGAMMLSTRSLHLLEHLEVELLGVLLASGRADDADLDAWVRNVHTR